MWPIVVGIVLALAGLAHSQNGLPGCAQNCVKQFTQGSEIGSCGNLDIQCICSNKNFLNGIACCLAAACDASDQAAAVLYAQQICATAGVTVPNAVVCVSSSTTAPATSATSSAGTSVASSTSAALVSVTSSSASTSASATKNAGIQNAAGVGMSFAGGLAAMFALL